MSEEELERRERLAVDAVRRLVQREAQARADVRYLRRALRQFVSKAGPRAHSLGCECGWHDGDGVSCKKLMDDAREALVRTDRRRSKGR